MKKYDFALSWSGNIKEFFIRSLQAACKKEQLSFFWICDDNVKEVFKKLDQGQIKISALLDTEATYNKKGDIYSRICYAIKDAGGAVINDPDRTKAAIDKSITHYELIDAGVTVPYTLVVRNWEPNSFKLADDDRKQLGVPFVIKPALGYGQLGVIRDAHGSVREIAKARNYDRGDNFLLQEKIVPVYLRGKRAWFRVFNVFDTIIPCWWDDHLNRYEHIAYEDFNRYRLFPLAKVVSKIASLTRMAWFSTEVAIDKKFGRSRFIAIDYVNDQCDMTAVSETPSGVPDPVVEYTTQSIVESASDWINNKDTKKKYTIWLKNANIEIRGLGSSPSLLKQIFPKTVPRVSRHNKLLDMFGQSKKVF
ncbi:MAG: hypothetical protein KJ619_07135 [Candidatus Omnitrophica bacterium]|nr:hypothetical protein [Candidatus Omnitrophota bacterium]